MNLRYIIYTVYRNYYHVLTLPSISTGDWGTYRLRWDRKTVAFFPFWRPLHTYPIPTSPSYTTNKDPDLWLDKSINRDHRKRPLQSTATFFLVTIMENLLLAMFLCHFLSMRCRILYIPQLCMQTFSPKCKFFYRWLEDPHSTQHKTKPLIALVAFAARLDSQLIFFPEKHLFAIHLFQWFLDAMFNHLVKLKYKVPWFWVKLPQAPCF